MPDTISHPDGLFELSLPSDWRWVADETGGSAVSAQPPGVLHLSAEAVEDPAELPNLSRMLAAFLTRTGRPVATDDLLRVPLVGAEGFSWQYIEDQKRAWRVWIFGNRTVWVFASFNCALEDAPVHQGSVDGLVHSLRLAGAK
ncbi:MAG: hypothetical protein KC910_23315 [Candidatus Eremiobacteraeota bacterium]|nr:hypothetical protein [Candidatus Eremiobacteraeota bacterium]